MTIKTNMNPFQDRMLTEELPDSHPIGDMLTKMFLRWYESLESLYEPSYCGRYLVRKDRHKAWGSPEHLSREMPW